jgi:hypothetical protein
VVDNPSIGDKGVIYLADSSSPRVAKESLKARWGEPDLIRTVDSGTERWDYAFGYRWNGVGVLAVIVPLPLFLPVGREHIYFFFEKDLVMRAEIFTDDFRLYAACFLFFIHADTPSCEAGTTDRVVRNKLLDVSKPKTGNDRQPP